jgi:hypothetical protein
MKRLKAYMPAGHLGTKRMGELAELAFMYRAASEGIGVARPYGDSHPYDFLIQHGRRLARVQVKSCFTKKRGYRRTQFQIHVVHALAKTKALYSQEDIDFIAAYIAPHQAWYVIPVEALGKSKTIYLYPGGKSTQIGAFFETYREAWQLLKEPENARTGESKQKTHPSPGAIPNS